MAGQGHKVQFHGSFDSKAAAVRKEQMTPRSYIRKAKTKRGVRYLVLTRNR
jgi:hypothetical protein